ncbi:MAG TPA: PEGA domain-containing protein, partial [Kofleriaceae bacterium]
MRVASGIALVVCIGTAEAGPTRKVPVESDPKGATVYVNDIDSGVACESTPCKIDAPIGKATIIVRKDGYNPEVTEIDTPRSGKIKTVKVELSSAVGTVIVEAAAFKGGKIIIDDVEKGTAPARIDVEAGTHTLKVVVKGKEVVADAFDLESASEHEVKPEEKAPQPPKVATAGFDDDDGEAKPRGVIEAHVDETKQADDAPHAP